MKQQFFALLLLLAAPVAALHAAEPDALATAEPAALATIDACITKLDKQIDVGYDRIAARCPDLAPTLERTGWAAWLPRSWKESRNDLSSGSLAELRRLVARELATRPAEHTPDVKNLSGVLTTLGSATQERSGFFLRLQKWIRSFFERSAAQKRNVSWLDDLASRLGVRESLIETITYIALAIAVALAGTVVVNELRLAGVLKRRREEARTADRLVGDAPRMATTWGDVERAALADQPRLLLGLIATRLTALHLLPHSDGLTVREILRAAQLTQPLDREHLNDLALTAEKARYAVESLAPQAVQSAVGNGRALLKRLESSQIAAESGA